MPDLVDNAIFAVMLSKRGFFGLLIALVVIRLGVHQNNAPNQEVVVQFAGQSVDTEQVENVVSLIKTQLEGLGVDQLSVIPSEEGRFIITYHSDHSAEAVKHSLAANGEFRVDDAHDPSPKTPASPENTYSVSVSDLHQDHLGIDTFVVEAQVKSPVASFPDTLGDAKASESRPFIDRKDSRSAFTTIAHIALQYHYKVPQVRAGPVTAC